MERGKKTIVYENWQENKGKQFEVIPIKFLSYINTKKRNPIIFEVNGIKYEGQKWKCKFKGKDRVFKIRVPYIEEYKDNNTNEIVELPNYHTHGINNFLNGTYTEYNWQLKSREEKKEKLLRLLINLNTEPSLTYHKFLNTPNLENLKKWNNQKRGKEYEALLENLRDFK